MLKKETQITGNRRKRKWLKVRCYGAKERGRCRNCPRGGKGQNNK